MTVFIQNGRGGLSGLLKIIGKFLRYSLLLFFFLIVACAVWFWLHGPQNYPGFQGSASTSAEKVHIKINGHDYWIPRYYIDSVSNSKVIEQKGALLTANMPDLTPRIKEKYDTKLAIKNMNYSASIHITNANYIVELGRNLEIHKMEYPYGLSMKKKYGLNYLYKLDSAGQKDKTVWGKEIYIINKSPENGFIECDLYMPNPRCSDNFEIKNLGLTVHLSYDLNYFPEWKKNRQKVTDFIRSFTSPPAPTEK